MTYGLKLSNGSVVELRFSMYFMKRACDMLKCGFSTIYAQLIGDVSELEEGRVNGGILDNIDTRAVVVAAGMEAHSFANGKSETQNPVSKEIFDIMENVEGGYASRQWAEIVGKMIESLSAQLPKSEIPKKKAAVKRKSPGQK